MIKGTIKQPDQLTAKIILDEIGEESIYKYYLETDYVENRPFCNPLRNDKNPSFMIGSKYGKLVHIDFADDKYKGGPIDFVQQKFGCSFPDALKRIAMDFSFGEYEVSGKSMPTLSKRKERKIIVPKETIIQVKAKKMDTADLAYWNSYHQDRNDLKNNNVYSVKELWIDRRRVNLPISELVFAYLYEGKWWKIYRPFAKRELKWKTNCPNDYVVDLEKIRNCEKAIITKSHKDKMVLQKVFPHVCSVQNESRSAFNDETVTFIRNNVTEPYINYDSDEPGKKASWDITAAFGFKHLNVSYEHHPIKDFADLAKEKGLKVIEDYLRLKQIL